ncbi:FUSC family protein [Roseibium aggregatum]|uniref:FUSC family protein n=1 Tax=Roseibium aggregatum TaxID=187304 RepID=A0A939EJP2_9HYPH|nr:FUSC family protein [Roseibium aggregatum]MBN9673971.1 FUSC family protein [Roseibium aggregatum]
MTRKSDTCPNEATAELALRRRDAAVLFLHRHRFLESLSLSAQPFLRNSLLAGFQAALAGAIVLPIVYYLTPWPHLAGFAALGSLVTLFGRFAPEAAQRRRIVLYSAVAQVLGVFVMSATGWLGLPSVPQLLLLALASGVFFFISLAGRFGPPGALIFIFAAGAAMGPLDSFHTVLERVAATAAGAALAWAVCALTERFRHTGDPELPLPVEPHQPVRARLSAAARIVLGAALAAFAVQTAGAGHPTWAVMGAVVVLQGANLQISMTRALQRMVGSLVGSALVWFVLAQEPSFATVILLVAFFQIATEFVIGANYGLGQIFVTPMALLMTYLAANGAHGASMAPERVFDTIVGSLIGIGLAVVFSSRDDRLHLARHHASRARA